MNIKTFGTQLRNWLESLRDTSASSQLWQDDDADEARDYRAEVARLELKSKHLVSSQFVGDYHAIFKGQGMTFDEVRPYSSGDDVRSIDWNVMARTGEPYVKRYIEERELNVMLLVDVSGSVEVGTVQRTKRAVALELASLLAFVASRNQDRIGCVVFAADVLEHLPTKRGRRHVLRLIHTLLETKPQISNEITTANMSNLPAAFASLNAMVKQRSIVFIVSDFLMDMAMLESSLKQASQHHDVIALVLQDRLDDMASLQDIGLLQLEDAETGEHLWLDTQVFAKQQSSSRLHAGKANSLTPALQERVEMFQRYGIDYTIIQSQDDAFMHLQRLFKARERRVHHPAKRGKRSA